MPYRRMCAIASSSERHHGRGEVQRQVFAAEVVLGRRHHVVLGRDHLGRAVHGDARIVQRRQRDRQERRRPPTRAPDSDSAALQTDGRDVFAFSRMDSAMSRSASASTYTWQLPTPVSITGTVEPFDHRPDQVGAAARDQHVDQAPRGHQLLHAGPRRRVDQRDRVVRQPAGGDRTAQRVHDRLVRSGGRRRTAQQHRVAGLQAQSGRVRGHVRPRFVDHRDHAERHPYLPQFQTVRQRRSADHLADRVRQRRRLPQPVGHRVDARGRRARAGRPWPPPRRLRGRRRRPPRLAAKISGVRATSASAIASSAASFADRLAVASDGRARSARVRPSSVTDDVIFEGS